jgi:hypothetical protein
VKEEIAKYQDHMVDCVIKAKNLQNEIGLQVGLSMKGATDFPVPVDAILKSLFKMTTREDLKAKIENALGSLTNEHTSGS